MFSRRALGLVLAACLLAGAAWADDDPSVAQKGVIDLDGSNWDKEIDGRTAALIEFYAPWCGHCKRLVPTYAELAQKVGADAKLKSRVKIAKINCDAHKDQCDKFSVRGFPTIKWFPRGKAKDPEEFVGNRNLENFVEFITGKLAADAGFARVDTLVPLARKFHEAAAEAKAAVLAEAETAAAAASEDDKANAALYVRFMKKAVEKGAEYIGKELARLTKMSEKAMSAAKLEEVSRKISVLSSFTEEPEAEAAPAAAAKGEAAPQAGKQPPAPPAPQDDEDEYEVDEEEEEEVYADGLDDNEGAEAEEEEEGDDDEDEGEEEEGGEGGAAAEDDDYDDSE